MFAGKWQVHGTLIPGGLLHHHGLAFGFAASGDCFFCSNSQAKWQDPQLMHLSRSIIRMVSSFRKLAHSASCRFSVLLAQRTFILQTFQFQAVSFDPSSLLIARSSAIFLSGCFPVRAGFENRNRAKLPGRIAFSREVEK